MGEWLRRAYSTRPHKICPRQAMSRPRERARPLIPITIEHADCLHRFSTASPVDKLAVDRRCPPCIRKVQTVALAVVPEKATNGALLADRGRCEGPGRMQFGTTVIRGNLANCLQAIRLLPASGPQTWRAPRSTVTIDLECKKDSTETPQDLMRGTRSSVMGKIIAVAARQDKVIESSNAE
jgi:hypothetical protein